MFYAHKTLRWLWWDGPNELSAQVTQLRCKIKCRKKEKKRNHACSRSNCVLEKADFLFRADCMVWVVPYSTDSPHAPQYKRARTVLTFVPHLLYQALACVPGAAALAELEQVPADTKVRAAMALCVKSYGCMRVILWLSKYGARTPAV